jgi:hypothetical protein
MPPIVSNTAYAVIGTGFTLDKGKQVLKEGSY